MTFEGTNRQAGSVVLRAVRRKDGQLQLLLPLPQLPERLHADCQTMNVSEGRQQKARRECPVKTLRPSAAASAPGMPACGMTSLRQEAMENALGQVRQCALMANHPESHVDARHVCMRFADEHFQHFMCFMCRKMHITACSPHLQQLVGRARTQLADEVERVLNILLHLQQQHTLNMQVCSFEDLTGWKNSCLSGCLR